MHVDKSRNHILIFQINAVLFRDCRQNLGESSIFHTE